MVFRASRVFRVPGFLGFLGFAGARFVGILGYRV